MKRDNVLQTRWHSAVDDGSLGLSHAAHARARRMTRKEWQRAMDRASGGTLARLDGKREAVQAVQAVQ